MNRAHHAREMVKLHAHPKAVSGLLGDEQAAITQNSKINYWKMITAKAEMLARRDQYFSDHCSLCCLQNTHCTCLSEEDEFTPQSGELPDSSTPMMNCTTKEQNVSFASKENCYAYNVTPAVDPTRSAQDTGDIMMQDFFKRPVKIFTTEWEVDSTLYRLINPWDLFITDTRVANRISNYNMFRGNLHIKVVLNGNGFHYGRALMSYLPLSNFDTVTQRRSTVLSELTQESQQPHVFLNPTMSTGGEMILPFFWHKNYASLPDGDFKDLGTLLIRSLQPLKHANGATDSATVSMFAWFDDIELTQLTSSNVDSLTPQAGEIDTANKDGAISTPATVVSKMAGKLAAIPQIAPFALATQGAASAVATAARAFGYSRPAVTKDPTPYKPLATSDLAPTTVPDGSRKMTVDDKQELTIDPRISGIGGDDTMSIKTIAKRESYLTQFTWAQADTPESFLYNMRIDPCMYSVNPGIDPEYFLTASAAAATPFKYWTGSMNIRFQFVCSAYHKGRVKIVYDPNFIANPAETYNTNYIHVVDLAEKQDFTVSIGPAQVNSLMDHNKIGIDSTNDLYSGFLQMVTKSFGNGVLGVYCLNELTTPNSTVNNDIQVNVFVSMGDDFEVFVPDDHYQNLSWDRLTPQSGEIFSPQSGEDSSPVEHTTGEEDAPQQGISDTLGVGEIQTRQLNAVFNGEAITSFRQMIKRYNLSTALASSNGTIEHGTAYGRRSAFPLYRGFVDGAVDVTGAANPYNYCNTVMLHWVTMLFQGYRGSVRYKIIPRGDLTANKPMLQVQRSSLDGDPTLGYRDGFEPWSIPSTNDARFQTVTDFTTTIDYPAPGQTFSGANGAIIFNGYLNPTAEFEVPYYSRERFTPGKIENPFATDIVNAWDFNITIRPGQFVSYELWTAAGEDFQTYFFTGMPGMFYSPKAPSP